MRGRCGEESLCMSRLVSNASETLQLLHGRNRKGNVADISLPSSAMLGEVSAATAGAVEIYVVV